VKFRGLCWLSSFAWLSCFWLVSFAIWSVFGIGVGPFKHRTLYLRRKIKRLVGACKQGRQTSRTISWEIWRLIRILVPRERWIHPVVWRQLRPCLNTWGPWCAVKMVADTISKARTNMPPQTDSTPRARSELTALNAVTVPRKKLTQILQMTGIEESLPSHAPS